MLLKHGLGLYKEIRHRAHCCHSEPCSVLPSVTLLSSFSPEVHGERLGLDLVRCGSCLNWVECSQQQCDCPLQYFSCSSLTIDPHGHGAPQLWREGCSVVKGAGLRAFRGKCLLSKRRRIRVSHLFPSGHAAPISHKEVAWLVYQTEIKAQAKRHTASLQGPRVCLHIPLGWRDSISARCGLRQSHP